MLSFEYFLIIPLMVAVDLRLGEPKYFHPLLGFGWLTDRVENLRKLSSKKTVLFLLGMLAWCVLVIPLVWITFVLENTFGWWFSLLVGYVAIAIKSLKDHALQVADALAQNDMTQARQKVAYIVSRDTSKLDDTGISRSTIESVLENGSDAIFAALFWFLIAGAPGAVLYRLSNTLDAMWGYRSDKYEYFGKFSARLDDILNFVPARLTALSYLLVGNTKQAWQCWQTQAKQWYSPNAGVVMATGAGALGVQLGGIAHYHGKDKKRPALGLGKAPQVEDIYRAWHLVFHTVLIWSAISLIIGVILWSI